MRERFGNRVFTVRSEIMNDGLLLRVEMPPITRGWAIPNRRIDDEAWALIHDRMLCEMTDDVLELVPYAD